MKWKLNEKTDGNKRVREKEVKKKKLLNQIIKFSSIAFLFYLYINYSQKESHWGGKEGEKQRELEGRKRDTCLNNILQDLHGETAILTGNDMAPERLWAGIISPV